MTDTELSPCPFCGAPGELFHDTTSDYARNWRWMAQCSDRGTCRVEGPLAETKEAAIARWNRRPPTVQVLADEWTTKAISATATIWMSGADSGSEFYSFAAGVCDQ